MMQQILINCSNEECPETPDLTQYHKHLNSCPYKSDPLYCPNAKDCKFRTLDQHELEEHLKLACKYETSTCVNCHLKIGRYNVDYHLRIECLKQNVVCRLCSQSTLREYYRDHLTNECPSQKYKCQQCGSILMP